MVMKNSRILMLGLLVAFYPVTSNATVKEKYQDAKEKVGGVYQDAKDKAKHGLQRTKEALAKSSEKVKNYFADPALGGVYYYTSMASNAPTIKEEIAGEFAINAAYYKYNPEALRQWFQRKATNAELSSWRKKATQWFQEETGEYDGGDIKKFIKDYHIDMTDYEQEDPAGYEDFNHFFYRTLKNGARKIDLRQEVVASPADCKLRVLPNISATSKFFIKQEPFNIKTFLNDAALAAHYEGGTLMSFRLAPTDYHRFHFPFDCTPSAPVLIKGEYETVSPIAFRVGLWPIAINKRARIILKSPIFGDVVMMVVGASMVASLNFTYTPGQPVEKSSEAGYFAFGGSTICLLFKKDVVTLPDVLVTRSKNNQLAQPAGSYEKTAAFETAVRMGQGVAMKKGSSGVDLLSDPRYSTFLSKMNKALIIDLDGTQISFAPNVTIRGRGLIGF
jgi:phosphatidylserine decarboxylase